MPELLCPAWHPCATQVFCAVILAEKPNLCFVTGPICTLPAAQAWPVLFNFIQSLLCRDWKVQKAINLGPLSVLLRAKVPQHSIISVIVTECVYWCTALCHMKTVSCLDQIFRPIIRFLINLPFFFFFFSFLICQGNEDQEMETWQRPPHKSFPSLFTMLANICAWLMRKTLTLWSFIYTHPTYSSHSNSMLDKSMCQKA